MPCLFLPLLFAAQANASTIATFDAGESIFPPFMNHFVGQSFTTSSGGAISNISFSWLDSPSDGGGRLAVGSLFLLTQECLGNRNDLDGSGAGFVAQSTGISAGTYLSDASVTLLGDTRYWACMDGTAGFGDDELTYGSNPGTTETLYFTKL